MLNLSIDPLQGGTFPGLDAHISMGWLLSPKEFARECLQTKQQPKYEGWALCAVLPDDLLRVLESSLVPQRGGISLLRSEQGLHYAVVLLQAGGTQIRMLLSLEETESQLWIREATARGKLNLAFEVKDHTQFFVVEMGCHLTTWPQVEPQLGKHASLNHIELVEDAARVAKSLASLETLPSMLDGFRTEHLRLVLAFNALPESGNAKSESEAAVLH